MIYGGSHRNNAASPWDGQLSNHNWVWCDLPSSQLHLSRDVTLAYSWRRAHTLASAQHWGFSPALGAFVPLVGNLISCIWQLRKNPELCIRGLEEVFQGAMGKQEVGVHTERGKQAQVTWLVSGINGNLRLRMTLENTANQSSPLKYAHIKAIWNEYLNAGLRRERTIALLTWS